MSSRDSPGSDDDDPRSPLGGGGANGGAGNAGNTTTPAACGFAPVRLWKLTPTQYANTVKQLMPEASVPLADLKKTSVTVGAFSNDSRSVDVSQPHVETLLASATALATQILPQASKVASCLATKPATEACLRTTLTTFGAQAFRRPLTSTEMDAYVNFYKKESASGGNDVGLKQFFRALFISPHFLYRTELGDETQASGGKTTLTAYERASALAYFLTDGPPDQALSDAAAKKKLESAADLELQARRLLQTPEGKRGLVKFVAEQMRADDVRTANKDASLTAWSSELASDLANETSLFLEHELFAGGGKLVDLLTSKTSFVNERVAKHYGVSGVTGSNFKQVTLPEARQGLLGKASFLAARAQPNETSIVKRGRFVREHLLCQSIPSAPPELANVAIPPKPDGVHTQRERIDEHSKNPVCEGCHKFMDPIGFAFEEFDTLGQWRSKGVTGKSIPTDGVVFSNTDTPDRSFANLAALNTTLADLPETRSCFAQQMFLYAQGREPDAADKCTLVELTDAFTKSGGDIKELAVKMVTSETFVTRIK